MYDRTKEDIGNVQMLEHVNLTVPDQNLAAMFYVTGLGFTRDPYIDFGTFNMWVNLGDQQFHLPTGKPQRLRGHVGVVVPDLEDLMRRLKFAERGLKDTLYSAREVNNTVQLTCPWGNHITAYSSDTFDDMALGMPYVQFDVPAGTSAGISRFYTQVLGCPSRVEGDCAIVDMGTNQTLRFAESDVPQSEYDGHHLAIYVANFSGPHSWLNERSLITEESDAYQYRFQAIIDPETEALLFEIEHEVRSLTHAMYRRPLVNRNPATNFFTYRKGAEQFSTPPKTRT